MSSTDRKRQRLNNGSHHHTSANTDESLWSSFTQAVDSTTQHRVQDAVLRLVFTERRSFHDRDHSHLPGPQPASLGRAALETIRTRRYEILEKSDGERCMFFGAHDGAFLIDRKFVCRRIDHGVYSLAIPGTLLDGEMIVGGNGATIYLAYDCVQFNGTNVGKQNLPERQRCIRDAVRDFHRVATSAADVPFNMTCKTFLPKHLVHQHFDCISKLPDGSYQYENVEHNLRNGNDGLIFTPVDEPYFPSSNQLLLKWKWFDLNSVDFKVVHPYFDDDSNLRLYCGAVGGDMMIRAIQLDEGTRTWLNANLPQHAGGIGIVECLYDPSLGSWVVKKIRPDKNTGNFATIVVKTLEAVIDNVSPQEICQICECQTCASVAPARSAPAPAPAHTPVVSSMMTARSHAHVAEPLRPSAMHPRSAPIAQTSARPAADIGFEFGPRPPSP